MEKVGKVVILGGTHGNELSGVFLVNKWMKNDADLRKRLTSCPVQLEISNPEAVKICRRYVDCDLNRQFDEKNYEKAKSKSGSLPYEVKRANEIHDMIEKSPAIEKPQLIIDLHNTTANTGCTLIVSTTACIFTMHLVAYVQMNMTKDGYMSKILVLGTKTYSCTRSLTERGIGLEVGPQPQGVLRADILKCQEKAVHYSLDFVDKFNKGHKFSAVSVEAFILAHRVGFPGLSSEVVIHEKIQDKDYEPLSPSDPVFRTMDDKVVYLKDVLKSEDISETLFPVFVNEAAYYEKDLAFWLTKAENVQLPDLKSKK